MDKTCQIYNDITFLILLLSCAPYFFSTILFVCII